MCEEVIASLNESQKSRLFNDDLRTTINLLKQTGGDRDQPLIEYMKAFEMSAFEREISVEIKLQHFLHFYEVAEGHCAK